MNAQIALQKTLQTKFIELRRNNSRFSLRAYAKRIGLNPGALSSILNGKRIVSKKLAFRIAQNLMLDPQERSNLVAAFQKRRINDQSKDLNFIRLTSSQFSVLADWEHFAILSLMNTTDFKSDVNWIASRLGISELRANQAINRLLQLELVVKSAAQILTRTKVGFRTSDDVAEVSVRKFHDKNLDLAKESLHRDPIEFRDFSATTFAIDIEKIPEAKAIIRKCQDELAMLLESGEQKEVYRFSCQLFPLTIIQKYFIKEKTK